MGASVPGVSLAQSDAVLGRVDGGWVKARAQVGPQGLWPPLRAFGPEILASLLPQGLSTLLLLRGMPFQPSCG